MIISIFDFYRQFYYNIIFMLEIRRIKKFEMLKQKGFTLAEVLITIGIIGVVASMTIPTLLNVIDQQANRTALLKFYSILYNATSSLANNNGGSIKGLAGYNWEYLNLYKTKLSVLRECNTPISTSNDCFGYPWLTLKKTAGWDVSSLSSLILKDGMIMTFNGGSKTCTVNDGGLPTGQECVQTIVDVNGQKPPNRMGYDIFRFYIYENKVVPYGAYGQTVPYPCTYNDRGDACAGKILANPDFIIPPN